MSHNNLLAAPTIDQQLVWESNLFLESIAKTKSPATLSSYSNKISVFTAWWYTHPVTRPLKLHLEGFRSHIDSKYESARSKNLVLSVVRSLFKFLYENTEMPENYAKHLKNFDVGEGHSKSALDKYQLHDLMDHLQSESSRNRAIISLGIANGLRVNEISHIEITDFDTKDGDNILWLLRKNYTDKSCYTILSADTYSILMDHKGNRTQGPLFMSQKGGGLSTSTLSKMVKKVLRGAGIDTPSVTAHSMRHTFGKLCVEAGVNIAQIMVAMNHKHMSATQVYARAYERHSQSAEKAINIYS